MEFNGFTGALKISLEKWGKTHPKYAKYYKAMDGKVLDIAHKALEEITMIKPGSWEVWWATNHNRFIRDNRQMDLIILHEVMYNFLTEFSRGEIGNGKPANRDKSGETKEKKG